MSNAIIFDIRGNPASFKSAIAQSVSSLSHFKTGLASIGGSIKGLVSGIMSMNTQILGFRGAMQGVDFIKGSVKEFSNFEHGMKQIKAVSGASGAELEQIGKIIEDVGMKTQFSVQDIQKGVFNLGTMGVKGTENFRTLTPAIANAAVSLDVDFNRAAEVVLSTLKQFNMPMKDASKVADMLTGAYTNSRMNLEMFAVSSQYAGLAAKAFGKGLDDLLPLLMSLNDQGIDASIAGTQLRTGFLKLLKPTAEARKELRKFGLSMKDVDANKLSFVDVLSNIEKSGMKMKSMVSVFGVRAAPIFDALINAKNVDTGKKGTAILRDYQKAVNDVGVSSRHAAERQKGLYFTFTVLDASMSVLRVKIGEFLQNFLNIDKAVQKVADSLVYMTEIIAKVDTKSLSTAGIKIFDPSELTKNLKTVLMNVAPAAMDYFGSMALMGAMTFLEALAANLPAIIKVGGQIMILSISSASKILANTILDLLKVSMQATSQIMANIKNSIADMLSQIPGFEGMAAQYRISAKEDLKERPGVNRWFDDTKRNVDYILGEGGKAVAEGWGQAVDTMDAVGNISEELRKSVKDFAKKRGLTLAELAVKEKTLIGAVMQVPTIGQKREFNKFAKESGFIAPEDKRISFSQMSNLWDFAKAQSLAKPPKKTLAQLMQKTLPIGSYTSPSEMTGFLTGGGEYGISPMPDRGLFRNVTRTTSEQAKVLQAWMQQNQGMKINEQAVSGGYKTGGATYIKVENNQGQTITNFSAKNRDAQVKPWGNIATPFGDSTK